MPSPTPVLLNIRTFDSVRESQLYRFWFLLENANGTNVTANVHVQLDVFDDTNAVLYSSQFDAKVSEYVDYRYTLTGQNIGKAYEWRVPATDMKKAISAVLGWGRAVLTLTTTSGQKVTAEDKSIEVPVYTDEELKQLAEAEYAKVAVSLNQKISKGQFEVLVTGAGFFDTYKWTKKTEYFRVDMEVRNIGNTADYFSPSGMVILDNKGSQYEKSYGGSLDTFVQIYPNVTKKGYVLFEGIPKAAGAVKLTFQLGHDAQYNSYLFEYSINVP